MRAWSLLATMVATANGGDKHVQLAVHLGKLRVQCVFRLSMVESRLNLCTKISQRL